MKPWLSMKPWLIAAGLTLAACSTTAASPDPAPPAGEGDLCRASEYQWLVGRQKDQIPAKPDGAVWRIACTACPVTMDFNAARMNIFFDKDTEVIKQVRCG